MQFSFDNTYHKNLEGFYVPWQGRKAPSPELIKLNHALAKRLGLDLTDIDEERAASIFSGSQMPEGASPLAQAYAGHQFGGFTPQLGDGRALLIGEVVNTLGQRQDIQLKGSGRTPFSRGGDGKAAIGPVLREYLISEAMHALDVPTTRSLAAVTTGEQVMREEVLPGAVLTRVASSHIRVGTFQYFAARGEQDKVKQLADYAILRHYSMVSDSQQPYLGFLEQVCNAQAALVAKWMSLGFIHGVMNTDNTAISGETIDYGPCAFMDYYDASTVFSSIDAQGRYAYQNQPSIAVWNLTRLAETLLPLFDDDEQRGIELATEVLNAFSQTYFAEWTTAMRAKLGLISARQQDQTLAIELLQTMEGQNVDFTSMFTSLTGVLEGDERLCLSLFDDTAPIKSWLGKWRERLNQEKQDDTTRITMMEKSNPVYIPRNHMVEEALAIATTDKDYSKFETLLEVVTKPFGRRAGLERYAEPAPTGGMPYQTFCGT